MKQIVFDIEANGLDPDTVWCIIAYEREAKEYIEWSKEDLHLFKDWIKEQDELEVIGHNIIGYDIPVLERLLDVDFSKCKVALRWSWFGELGSATKPTERRTQ
jgi:hypothetical protein